MADDGESCQRRRVKRLKHHPVAMTCSMLSATIERRLTAKNRRYGPTRSAAKRRGEVSDNSGMRASSSVSLDQRKAKRGREGGSLFFRTMVRRTAALLVLVSVVEVTGQRPSAPTVSIDADDIGGVVASAAGPEAGVWVIAETTDLPTRFAKVVTTDEQGRFLVPDLPRATYDLWVRGYGLVDSSRVRSMPGTTVNRLLSRHPPHQQRPSTIRRSTGSRCSGFLRDRNSRLERSRARERG